jgi:hypothetical protein
MTSTGRPSARSLDTAEPEDKESARTSYFDRSSCNSSPV